MSCFAYLVVVTAIHVALGSDHEAYGKPQTEQGNTVSDVQVVINEHLFTAGNDSTGTAAITYTSRLDLGTPTINQFIKHSFPHSCTSHPTRCRELTYLSYRDNRTNHTRLTFYVPLTGPKSAALGLMEFWHDGETISQNATTRIIKTGQCDPVAVVRVPKIGIYMICASGGYYLELCEVRNRNNVSSAWLSCTAPHSLNQPLTNLSLLSNFVIYISRPFDLYFVYNSVLYHMTHDGAIEGIALLQTSHCHYVHLTPVNASFLIGHCYKQSQVEAFYFYLDIHQYITISQEDATIAHYHCPNPRQLVTISVFSQPHITQASFQDRGVDKGRFNLNANQVIFAECFQSRNQTHFIYQDSELGVFIKPNISIDLRLRLVRLPDLRCHHIDQPCKQPLIFSDRYLVLTYDMDDIHRQGMAVFDLYQDLNRTLSIVTNSTAQIVFFSDFTKSLVTEEDDNEDKDPDNKHRKSPSPRTVGVAIGVSLVIILFGVIPLAATLISVKYCKKEEARRCCRPYAPVAGNDIKEEVKLKDIKKAHETNEPQATHLLYSKEDSSSPTPPPPEETVTNAQRTPDGVDPPEPVVVANPETLPSHSSEGNMSQGANALSQLLTSEDLPHQRSQYLIEGASQDDIPASLQCTQPSTRTYIAGCGPPLLQHMDPAAPNSWGSPPKTSHSFGMPLLECNERPTTTGSTSTVYPTQFDSRLHDTTGTCTIRERPQRGFQRQSSLPNPPRPRTLIPQAQQLRLNQSPQQQRPNYNTNTTTSSATTHSLTPDNDLEYRRQLQHVQQQWPCQGQPTTARMNSSDSTNSTRSRTSTTSTRTPPMDFSHSSPPLPPLEHAYIHANPPQSHMHNTVAQHQPMNAATGHHHGPRNFHRLDSRESANSVTSLTPESKPESGHQTGSMLVTGTYH